MSTAHSNSLFNIRNQSLIAYTNAIGQWHKFTVSYADFAANDTTSTISLVTIPEQSLLECIISGANTGFTGGSVSNATIAAIMNSSHIADDAVFSINPLNFSPASIGTTFITLNGPKTITLMLETTGDNINALTAGSYDIYLKISTVPTQF